MFRNPMMGQLSKLNPQVSQLKQVVGAIRNAGNPQVMMMQMLQQNPNYQKALDYIQQCGGDQQKAFYQMAREKGIDPEEVLSVLRGA